MTPERAAQVVARWVRLYTRNLPAAVAERRIDEIDADVQDHIVHERARGTDEPRIARGIAGRMLRGVAADLTWRVSNPKERRKMSRTSYIRVAIVTALVLLVPLIGMQVSDGVDWGVFDFVFMAILVGGTGLLLELAFTRPGSVVLRLLAAAIAVVVMALGEADDAPGLVLIGFLIILGTIALTLRRPQRSD